MFLEIRNVLLNITLLVFIHIFVSHIYSQYCSQYYNIIDIFGLSIVRNECKILLKVINTTSNLIENLHIFVITSIITIIKMYKSPVKTNEIIQNLI